MKNTQQVTMEIMERSKIRIKKKRSLLACVSALCVCGLITGVLILPDSINDFYTDKTESYGYAEQSVQLEPENIVNIVYNGKTYTKKEEIRKISDAISVITDSVINNTSDDLSDEKYYLMSDIEGEKICITTQNGEVIEYVVSESAMSNEKTGQVFIISQNQKQKLENVLK